MPETETVECPHCGNVGRKPSNEYIGKQVSCKCGKRLLFDGATLKAVELPMPKKRARRPILSKTQVVGLLSFIGGAVACGCLLIPVAYFDVAEKRDRIAKLQSFLDDTNSRLDAANSQLELVEFKYKSLRSAPPVKTVEFVPVEINSPMIGVPQHKRVDDAIAKVGYHPISDTDIGQNYAKLQVFERELEDCSIRVGQIYSTKSGEVAVVTIVASIKSTKFRVEANHKILVDEAKKLVGVLIGHVRSLDTLLNNPVGTLKQDLGTIWEISVTRNESPGLDAKSQLFELIVSPKK